MRAPPSPSDGKPDPWSDRAPHHQRPCHEIRHLRPPVPDIRLPAIRFRKPDPRCPRPARRSDLGARHDHRLRSPPHAARRRHPPVESRGPRAVGREHRFVRPGRRGDRRGRQRRLARLRARRPARRSCRWARSPENRRAARRFVGRRAPAKGAVEAFLVGAAATTLNLRLRPRPRWQLHGARAAPVARRAGATRRGDDDPRHHCAAARIQHARARSHHRDGRGLPRGPARPPRDGRLDRPGHRPRTALLRRVRLHQRVGRPHQCRRDRVRHGRPLREHRPRHRRRLGDDRSPAHRSRRSGDAGALDRSHPDPRREPAGLPHPTRSGATRRRRVPRARTVRPRHGGRRIARPGHRIDAVRTASNSAASTTAPPAVVRSRTARSWVSRRSIPPARPCPSARG